MNNNDPRVVDFHTASKRARTGYAPPGRPAVDLRIQQKKDLLKRWLREGILEDEQEIFARIPTSLNGMREWDEPDFGIHKIGSPNAFTTKNRDVKEIARLLTELHKRYDKPRATKRLAPKHEEPRRIYEDLRHIAEEAASRWQIERHHRLAAEKRAETAEGRERMFRRERDEARSALRAAEAQLRRQAHGVADLKVVE
jgi:hypothetical protein